MLFPGLESGAQRSMLEAVFVFFFLFACQVFIWRRYRPGREIACLFILYLLPPVLFAPFRPFTGAILLVLSTSYVISFPAIQAQSPSLSLLLALRRHGKPLSRVELVSQLAHESLLQDRRKDLSAEGLVDEYGKLKPAGAALAKIFRFLRAWFGISGRSG